MKTSASPNWFDPITELEPSGANLEYDNNYIILQTQLAHKDEVQYGNFTAKPEVIDWASIERACQTLLLQSKDITLLIWLIRCKVNRKGVTGLCEGLDLLRRLIQTFGDTIHPQHVIDGHRDLGHRANALAALADNEGLVADIRKLKLFNDTALRLTIKDIERTLSKPYQSEADTHATIAHLKYLYQNNHGERLALAEAYGHLQEIIAWGKQDLGDEMPDLAFLSKILNYFSPPTEKDTLPTSNIANPLNQLEPCIMEDSSLSMKSNINEQREQVRRQIQMVKAWFEDNEPSSPVAILLKQAERLVGKRFSEVTAIIPIDLLEQWDKS